LGLSLVIAIPLLVVAVSLFLPSDDVWQHLRETVLTEYIRNSMFLLLGVTLLVLPLGVIPAWLVTMYRFPGSRILEWALLLPMAVPAYIIAYTYTGMLDVAGPVQSALREAMGWEYGDYWFPPIRSLGGAIIMLSLVLYPYVYLLSRAAFIEQSVCVLEVSRTLGCNPRTAFRRVALPLARPAIVVGLSIALMETLADFGTVQYFGIAAFTTGIYRTWYGLGSSVAATQLAALLMLFVLVLVLIEGWSRRQSRYYNTSTRYQALSRTRLRGRHLLGTYLVCIGPVLAGFVIPVVQLAAWALTTAERIFTLRFFELAWNTLSLAVISACVALLIALFISYGKRLFPHILSTLSFRVLSLGYALPGTVIAIGVLVPFSWLDRHISAFMESWLGINTGLLLSGTIFILIFAYMVRFLPIALNSVDAALGKIKPSMDEAALSMGQGNAATLRRVHMPMMRGSMVAALLLVFVDVVKELPATLILRPFNFNTLAIRTYELANEERLADAAGPALTIVLVSIIPVILLSRQLSRARVGYAADAQA
jgi:iron(III) transport system permease protein